MQFRKRNLVFFSALLTFVVVASGCLKSVDSTPPRPQTYISFLHLAPSAPDVDVYLNSTKSTQTPVPSGTFFNRYSPLDPNMYAITFKKGGGDSVVASIATDIYDSLTYFTLLLFDNQFGAGAQAVRIDDDFSQFSSTQTNLRFFHVAPGLMPVDVYFDNDKVYSSREYVDNVANSYYNVFQHRNSGFFNLIIKKAGSDSLILQTSTSMAQAQAYTILLSGKAGGSGAHALAVDILQATN